MIRKLKEEMKQAAKELEFEKAAGLRDRIRELTKLMLEMGASLNPFGRIRGNFLLFQTGATLPAPSGWRRRRWRRSGSPRP